MDQEPSNSECMYALITGANSGLGFALCCRLVDEFLSTRPATESLHLILTTRNSHKGAATINRLHQHFSQSSPRWRHRVTLHAEEVELTSLNSVEDLAQRLLASAEVPKLDCIILNAGIGGFAGINWPVAVWSLLTSPMAAATHPTFKLGSIGLATVPQHRKTTTVDPTPDDSQPSSHPPLGEIFCANVFGHYLLAHFLTPLLLRASPTHGRIIWISSLEAYERCFSAADLQGLSSPVAYESSKRLTDILVMTASLPSTRPFVSRFLSPHQPNTSLQPSSSNQTTPKLYVAHPGICATSIVPLPLISQYTMVLLFYIVRWLGSPWHTVRAYVGASAPVWLALAPQDELDATDDDDDGDRGGRSKIKWGSGTDRAGREIIRRTEVEGFDESSGTTSHGDSDQKKEASQEFEELGRTCWMQMEALREEWEERLGFGDDHS